MEPLNEQPPDFAPLDETPPKIKKKVTMVEEPIEIIQSESQETEQSDWDNYDFPEDFED